MELDRAPDVGITQCAVSGTVQQQGVQTGLRPPATDLGGITATREPGNSSALSFLHGLRLTGQLATELEPGAAEAQPWPCLSCTTSRPVAQKTRDNSGTSPSGLFLQLRAKWQQRPETPALISRIHTSSSHHTPHQCSDSAEEWIRPASNHPLPRRTAPMVHPSDEGLFKAAPSPKRGRQNE